MGIRTRFVRAEPRGRIRVQYSLRHEGIDVEAMINIRETGCEKIVFLNEQGATTFRRVRDGSGLEFVDAQIGAWSRVHSETCAFSDLEGEFTFKLRRLPGVELYRGRELVDGRFSWAGFACELTPPKSAFKYTIGFEMKQRG